MSSPFQKNFSAKSPMSPLNGAYASGAGGMVAQSDRAAFDKLTNDIVSATTKAVKRGRKNAEKDKEATNKKFSKNALEDRIFEPEILEKEVEREDIDVYDESNVEFDDLINSSNKEILKQSIKTPSAKQSVKTPSVKQLGKIFDAGKSIFKNL